MQEKWQIRKSKMREREVRKIIKMKYDAKISDIKKILDVHNKAHYLTCIVNPAIRQSIFFLKKGAIINSIPWNRDWSPPTQVVDEMRWPLLFRVSPSANKEMLSFPLRKGGRQERCLRSTVMYKEVSMRMGVLSTFYSLSEKEGQLGFHWKNVSRDIKLCEWDPEVW